MRALLLLTALWVAPSETPTPSATALPIATRHDVDGLMAASEALPPGAPFTLEALHQGRTLRFTLTK